jgi:hypothetical protein
MTRKRKRTGPERTFNPSVRELKKLYQSRSMRQIAAHYGVGETVVWKRLHEHGITLKGFENGGHRKKAGRVFSAEHRANLSKAHLALNRRGERHPNWKGGRTAVDLVKRKSAEASEWRRKVFRKAEYKCEECGKRQGENCSRCEMKFHLYAHHIKPWSEYPDLRFDPANGRALCSVCHDRSHGRITE